MECAVRLLIVFMKQHQQAEVGVATISMHIICLTLKSELTFGFYASH